MGFLEDLFDNNPKPRESTPSNPKWVTNKRGHFHKLVDLDPDKEGLQNTSAVYVVWHKGIKPAWVFVGKTRNLAETLYEMGRNDFLMHEDKHGGLYVTWSLVRNEFQDGVVKYLTDTLKPKIKNPFAPGPGTKPVPVLPPGG